MSSATASSVLCGSLPLLLYITLYGILGFPPANPHRGLASTCNRSLKLLASPLKGEDKSIAVRRESSFQSQKSCGQLYIVRVRHTTRFVSFADLLQYFSLANMIRQCFTNWHLSVTLTPIDPNETGDSIQAWAAEPKSRINIWALQNCGRKIISVQNFIMPAACHMLILLLIAATGSCILLWGRVLSKFFKLFAKKKLDEGRGTRAVAFLDWN